MGLIVEDAAYATEYGELFPRPDCPGIYATDIYKTKDASINIRKKDAVHKESISDWEIYDVAESEANNFIFPVVAKRENKELLDQLQVVCTGHHSINLLALQD